jgi:hypothetical protein
LRALCVKCIRVDGKFVSGRDDDGEKRRNAAFLLYDRPLWRDWLTYVTLLAEGLNVALAIGVAVGGAIAGAFEGAAVLFVVQLLLFGVLPGFARLGVRRAVARRRERATT